MCAGRAFSSAGKWMLENLDTMPFSRAHAGDQVKVERNEYRGR